MFYYLLYFYFRISYCFIFYFGIFFICFNFLFWYFIICFIFFILVFHYLLYSFLLIFYSFINPRKIKSTHFHKIKKNKDKISPKIHLKSYLRAKDKKDENIEEFWVWKIESSCRIFFLLIHFSFFLSFFLWFQSLSFFLCIFFF